MTDLVDALNKWGASWLDADDHDTEKAADAARARLLLTLCLGTIVVTLLMGAFWFVAGVPVLAAGHLLGGCSMAGTWPAMRWSRSVTLAANWATFSVVATLCSLIPFGGGIHSPGTDWLILAPILAFVFGDRYSGLVWGGVTVLSLTVFALIPEDVYRVRNYAVEANQDLLKVVSTVLMMALLTGLFILVRRYQRELLDLAYDYRQDATVDSLTKLANRRAFEQQLSVRIERARRQRNRLAVAVLDIDDFKSINDEYGHPTGDTVLQKLAARLDRTLRGRDLAARFGGDEFTVLLEGFDEPADLDVIGRRIREAFAEPIQTPKGPMEIRSSMGFAILADDALRRLDNQEARDRALEVSDSAMYESKTTERDWVVEHLE